MTRKIVLFVVEGPTDADLLLPVFNAMLTRHDVRWELASILFDRLA